MGGCVFLLMALLALLVTWGSEALVFWSLPIAGGAIGLVDDGMKFFRRSSEGFRSLAKLKVQLVVCVAWVPLVCAQLGDPARALDEAVITGATAVELTHLASLYHDDVMDSASVRRGVPSGREIGRASCRERV